MLSIVPFKVKVRVALWSLFAVGVMALPWAIPLTIFPPAARLFIRVAITLDVAVFGVYALWCFWPRMTWGCPLPREPLGKQNKLHLTFDDGPSPDLTDRILDLLRRYRVQASFFVLANKVVDHPDLIRRMISEGHTVGLHGQDHALPFSKSYQELKGNLSQAKGQLEKVTGTPVTLYRPSHGWKTIPLVKAVKDLGLSFCFWDYGVWDTDAPLQNILEKRMLAVAEHAQNRGATVLLLHDGLGDEKGFPPHGTVLLGALQTLLDRS